MKFVVTEELGRLARWLRILGYDVLYEKHSKESEVVLAALKDDRVIVTRYRKLLVHRRRGMRIVHINSDSFGEQIRAVVGELKIGFDKEKMFSRCIICNMELVEAEKEAIKEKVPEYVYETQEEFFRCPGCERIYWAGTHWGNAERYIKGALHS